VATNDGEERGWRGCRRGESRKRGDGDYRHRGQSLHRGKRSCCLCCVLTFLQALHRLDLLRSPYANASGLPFFFTHAFRSFVFYLGTPKVDILIESPTTVASVLTGLLEPRGTLSYTRFLEIVSSKLAFDYCTKLGYCMRHVKLRTLTH
jgi:hypothetical protein